MRDEVLKLSSELSDSMFDDVAAHAASHERCHFDADEMFLPRDSTVKCLEVFISWGSDVLCCGDTNDCLQSVNVGYQAKHLGPDPSIELLGADGGAGARLGSVLLSAVAIVEVALAFALASCEPVHRGSAFRFKPAGTD